MHWLTVILAMTYLHSRMRPGAPGHNTRSLLKQTTLFMYIVLKPTSNVLP
jgi:hypothetical protein